MEPNKAAAIVSDVVLQEEGRNYFFLSDGAVLAVGKVKGHRNTVFVKVKVESNAVVIDVWPVDGGRLFAWDIFTHNITDDRLKECAQESLEGVIRLNKWDAPSRR